MTEEFLSYLSSVEKKRVLFITTSNRWKGDSEIPKSTQLAQEFAFELEKSGIAVTLIDVSSLKIFPCEGNVSVMKGNSCGLKEAILKDKEKNPTGYHRCWASINNPDDELWRISKELLQSDAVVFFISVRWGQTNSLDQKLIERLSWIENRHASLGESNIVKNIDAGCVVVGQNWRANEVMEIQKEVYNYYGFKVPPQLSFSWQFTMDTEDETLNSYLKAPSAFENFFKMLLKKASKIKESVKLLKFDNFKKMLRDEKV